MSKIEPAYVLGTTKTVRYQKQEISFCISPIEDKSLIAQGVYFDLTINIDDCDPFFDHSYSAKDSAYLYAENHLRYIKSHYPETIVKQFAKIDYCKQWLDILIMKWACYHRDLQFNLHDQEDIIKEIKKGKIKF